MEKGGDIIMSKDPPGLKKQPEDDVTVSSSSADSDIDMPLLKYARLVGSLPRVPPNKAFASPCTCSAMGKVILTPDVLDGSADGMTLQKRQSDLVWKYPHHVLAIGFQDGMLSLVDARTGVAIVPSDQLKESRDALVVDVGFDASGTHLAAMYVNGVCAIWELRYAVSVMTTAEPSTTATTEHASETVFSWFKGAAAPTANATDDATSSPTHEPARTTIPTLKTTSCQASRISYPSSFGPPTCMAIDPSYKRKREKTILVGFRDGRLVMTKRGFFQRRNDGVIYQGTFGDIESIAWRGPLVAWTDFSGIKLFDVDTMTRIAHIDRPAGAREALYPSISSLRPSLLFETSDSLLCAWGDCLMSMSLEEKTVSRRNAEISEEEPPRGSSQQEAVAKRRTVQCNMAWELDCVACGVVPMDEEHVVVLGLVPTGEKSRPNDLEVHVVSRSEGTITYADALPLIQSADSGGKDSTSGYMLLSSYGLPRMEDAVEAEEDRILNGDDQEIDFQMTLFGSNTKTESFKDPHKKWSLEQLVFEDETDKEKIPDPEDTGKDDEKTDEQDSQSVDSDDYSFVFRPSKTVQSNGVSSPSTFPPLMVIVSPFDALLIRAREVDDAVSHSLSAKKYGIALRRALTHKRQLREYDINQLIDEYLRAVLRMNEANYLEAGERTELSIRRVKVAAQAMPMLLGRNIQMWDRWVDQFSKIPGGLFILRWQLPVRDPILPAKVYESVLSTMLSEIEEVLATKAQERTSHDDMLLYPQMMIHFLTALIAWGPTRSLREKIQLHKYNADRKRKKAGTAELPEDPVLIDAEKTLDRRLHQTASGYLQLPNSPSLHHESSVPLSAPSPPFDDSSDSLFDVDGVLAKISVHVPLLSADDERVDAKTANNHAALEAMAELNMMKGRYEMALKCFLLIGCLHVMPDVSTVEKTAILAVNDESRVPRFTENNEYGFVLAMIEYQHLHQCLLDDNFIAASVNDKTQNISNPLVALIQLVGLENAGDFLVEHCVPPPDRKAPSSPAAFQSRSSDVSGTNERQNWHETLPINLVADQLRPSPQLLHWYLHQIFVRKPEMYVKFPRTAVPPRSVTELHRSHLELYIEYTDKRDSAKALSGTETYNLERMTTPLLSFLKAALPLGGIRPDEARRLLEAERNGNAQGVQSDVVQLPHHFALELAYIFEHFVRGSEEDAKQILDLYLNGSESLMLAVSYAQRNTTYGSQLWTILIDHCLNSAQDGSLFGSLLECAAQCGADLGHLVTQIPQGMQIEGLRPRLVAAVADYRWKLKMHEAASSIGTNERIVLLRELAHRSKRGMRFSRLAAEYEAPNFLSPPAPPERKPSKSSGLKVATMPNRPLERPNRYRLSLAVPIR